MNKLANIPLDDLEDMSDAARFFDRKASDRARGTTARRLREDDRNNKHARQERVRDRSHKHNW